jgi:hypothetical protein
LGAIRALVVLGEFWVSGRAGAYEIMENLLGIILILSLRGWVCGAGAAAFVWDD